MTCLSASAPKEEYCIAEYGEGLYEAEYSGVGTTEEHILQEYDVTSPAIPMTDLELYWEFLPKALSIMVFICYWPDKFICLP